MSSRSALNGWWACCRCQRANSFALSPFLCPICIHSRCDSCPTLVAPSNRYEHKPTIDFQAQIRARSETSDKITSPPVAKISATATSLYASNAPGLTSRREMEILIAQRLKDSGQTSITRAELDRCVDEAMSQISGEKLQNGARNPPANPKSSRPAIYDRHSSPAVGGARSGTVDRPELSTSDRYAARGDIGRSASVGTPSADVSRLWSFRHIN